MTDLRFLYLERHIKKLQKEIENAKKDLSICTKAHDRLGIQLNGQRVLRLEKELADLLRLNNEKADREREKR